jgi:predicted N-acetyltransferase YhbS
MQPCVGLWPRLRAPIAADFVSEAVGDGHDVASFRCGEDALDEWLKNSARTAETRRTARTFVWSTEGRQVVAYYSLAAYAIAPDTVSRSMAGGAREQIPAILLARLALDQSMHGQGLGAKLLGHALNKAVAASYLAGARFVVVDALNVGAHHFYSHFGFSDTPMPNRLIMKVSTIVDGLR